MRNLKIAISLLFFSFISVQAAHANFTVIQRALNPYQLKSTDIWGLDIMSTESQAVNVKLYGTISKDGVPVVKLESRAVRINPGANALTSFNVSISKINYLNKNISEIERLTLSLPPGSYQYCVYLRCATVGCDGLGTPPFDLEKIYCTNVQVEPPTPLQLAYPGNESKIKETRPGLNWIPPGPIVQSSKLNYIITLVEMNEKQNRMDAIKRNRPLLRKRGHSLNTLMFPLDLNELEVGKSYAWQVEAWVGDQWLSTSEVWEFEIVQDTIKEENIPKVQSYINIEKQHGEAKYYAKQVLKLKYLHRGMSGSLSVEVQGSKNEVLQTEKLNLSRGENYFSIELPQQNGYKEGDQYSALITNSEGKSFLIKFIYILKKDQ